MGAHGELRRRGANGGCPGAVIAHERSAREYVDMALRSWGPPAHGPDQSVRWSGGSMFSHPVQVQLWVANW